MAESFLHSIGRYLNRIPIINLFVFSKKIKSNKMAFPFSMKTIQDFGYGFNIDGELRQLNEDGEPGEEPFQFHVSNKHAECQQHYEEIGEMVTQYVYNLLETQENLHRLPIPTDAPPNSGTFIFASEDYDKKETLLVLIHGSGVVRAGQWARSIIINECLDMGTQIPYIKTAISKDYGVLIMNTNDNYSGDEKIPGSATPSEHGVYVWENYISGSVAKNVLIVAHSYGGVVTLSMADKIDEFKERVKAIALTDSVHGYVSTGMSRFLKKVARNWVGSSKPLDAPIKTHRNDITRVSAGHCKHEMTSYSCMESVFQFFEDRLLASDVPEMMSTDDDDDDDVVDIVVTDDEKEKGTVPKEDDEASSHKDVMTSSNDKKPLNEDVTPLKEDVKPLKEDVKPLKEDVKPLKEDIELEKEETTSPHQDTSTKEAITPQSMDIQPSADEMPTAKDNKTPPVPANRNLQ